MSNASVLLPEPDTPVITVNLPRGIATSMPLRLCSRALTMRMVSSSELLAVERRRLLTSDCRLGPSLLSSRTPSALKRASSTAA